MTNFQRINQPRAEKAAQMVRTIKKSANSNRATAEEVAAVLAPLLAECAGYTSSTIPDHTPQPERPKAPPLDPLDPDAWSPYRVARMVDTVPVGLLTSALTCITNRMAELFETTVLQQGKE